MKPLLERKKQQTTKPVIGVEVKELSYYSSTSNFFEVPFKGSGTFISLKAVKNTVLFIQRVFGFFFFYLFRLGKATNILQFEITFVNSVKERKIN